LESKGGGTTFREINKGILEDFAIPLPPLPEQQKIARVLSTIQRAVEQQGKIIEATKKLKKSLMQKLFRFGISDLGVADLKDTKIGLIPKSWEVVRLGEVVNFSKKPRTLNLNSFEKIPFIPMEMIPIEKTYISNYMLKAPDKILSGVYCEREDILLPKITPCFENGKQGIIKDIPSDFAFATTEVYPIKPKNDLLDKMFLFYFLVKPDIRKVIADKMQGTTGRRRVPKDAVEDTLTPLPSLPEQQEIAHILSTVDKKIEIEERRKATLKELFKTMLHKLMTGEIRVKDVEI
jgi:type I restriction enzyme S subunit